MTIDDAPITGTPALLPEQLGTTGQPTVMSKARVLIRSGPHSAADRVLLTAVKSASGYELRSRAEVGGARGQLWDMEHLAWPAVEGSPWPITWGWRFSQVLDGARLNVTWRKGFDGLSLEPRLAGEQDDARQTFLAIVSEGVGGTLGLWVDNGNRVAAPLIISRPGGDRAVEMVPQPAWTPGKTLDSQWWEIAYGGDWPAMPVQTTVVNNVIRQADQDRTFKAGFVSNPSVVLSQAGFPLPVEHFEAFDVWFAKNDPLIKALADDRPTAEVLGGAYLCILCRIASWSLAAGLVVIGAVGLPMLTAQTPIVVAVASSFGITAPAALKFVVGLAYIAVWQLDKVLDAFCEWAGVCP